jgi:hypothetical protein
VSSQSRPSFSSCCVVTAKVRGWPYLIVVTVVVDVVDRVVAVVLVVFEWLASVERSRGGWN